MAEPAAHAHLDAETYLTIEARYADLRHELVGGQMYAMSGARRRHNLLADAFQAALRTPARACGCRAYRADMKLRVGEEFYYPDTMVVCAEPDDDRYETEPCLIVEVLSPSTRTIDTREKVGTYTRIESLRAYVIANPDAAHVEVHRRGSDGSWTMTAYGPGDTVALEYPGVDIDVDALYDGVE